MKGKTISCGPGKRPNSFVIVVKDAEDFIEARVWSTVNGVPAVAKYAHFENEEPKLVFAKEQHALKWPHSGKKQQSDFVNCALSGSPSWALTLDANLETLGAPAVLREKLREDLALKTTGAGWNEVVEWGKWACFTPPAIPATDEEFKAAVISLLEGDQETVKFPALADFAKSIGADMEWANYFNGVGAAMQDMSPDDHRKHIAPIVKMLKAVQSGSPEELNKLLGEYEKTMPKGAKSRALMRDISGKMRDLKKALG